MEELLQWASARGASFKAAPQADKPRKLFATQNITPGDVIISVPADLLLHGGLAFSDREYGAAFRALLSEVGRAQLDQRSLLVLLVVVERCRGDASAFAPYISFLPHEYDDPFWWGEADLALLQGTRLRQAVQHYTAGLQQLHTWLLRLEELHQLHQQQQQQQGAAPAAAAAAAGGGGALSSTPGGWGLSPAAVRWARSAVWSRAFTIKGLKTAGPTAAPTAAAGSVVALVPVLDMCDHHPEQRVSWRVVPALEELQQQQQQLEQEQEQQVFQFTTLMPVAKGAELFNNYGSTKPNEELLLGYGFVLQPNSHDSFLVSIINRAAGSAAAAGAAHSSAGGSAANAGSAGSAGSMDESACDDSAVWQQRLSICAAAGLRLEVAITQQQLLPPALLDVLLVAAAAPGWQLPQLLLWVQQQQVQEQGYCAGDLFAAASAKQQCVVLLQLRQQLAAKLAGMTTAAQLQRLLVLAEEAPSRSAAAHEQHQHGGCGGGGSSSGNEGVIQQSNPHHAKLAAMYVQSQHKLLCGALQAVQAAASKTLQAAATAAEPAANASSTAAPDRPSGQLLSQASAQGMASGSLVLSMPLSQCLVASSIQGLVLQVMLLVAEHLPQQLQQEGQQSPQQQQHFAAAWAADEASGWSGLQLLPWWLTGQEQELLELLHDTPAGQLLLQASEELQEDFQQLFQQQQQQQQLVELVARDQATAFRLFCWASRLVERAAVQLPTAPDRSNEAGSGNSQQQLVLAPGLEGVPRELAAIAFTFSISSQQPPPDGVLLTVRAACALPPGLLQLPIAAADSWRWAGSSSTVQQLLVECGPAAVACALLCHDGPHQSEQQQSEQQQSEQQQSEQRQSEQQQSEQQQSEQQPIAMQRQSEQQPIAMQRHVYELTVCPSEDDPLRAAKLQLLAATGLGLCHHFPMLDNSHAGPAQQLQQQDKQQLESVLVAMAIAMCDDDQLLATPAIAAIHEQQQQFSTVTWTVAPTTALLEDAAAAPPAASPAAAGSSWRELQCELLRRHRKSCLKQLKGALQAELQSVTAAAEDTCLLPGPADVDTDGAMDGVAAASLPAAVQGVRAYLSGMQHVLSGWLQACSAAARSGPADDRLAGGSRKRGGKKRRGNGDKAAKQQRRD